jgi:hypothetical protein
MLVAAAAVSGAREALQRAAIAALSAVEDLGGVYPGQPLQAALPHALVEPGIESDWSHKSGKGREVRLFVTLKDEGERPERLQALSAAAEAAIEGLPAELEGWRMASLQFVRSRTAAELRVRATFPVWATVIEYRARMLATG